MVEWACCSPWYPSRTNANDFKVCWQWRLLSTVMLYYCEIFISHLGNKWGKTILYNSHKRMSQGASFGQFEKMVWKKAISDSSRFYSFKIDVRKVNKTQSSNFRTILWKCNGPSLYKIDASCSLFFVSVIRRT